MACRKKKRSHARKAPAEILPVRLASPEPVQIAADMVLLNRRQLVIQARLGVIQSEAAKLSAEQNGINIRREKLLRAFDVAAKPV
jgi:hypothetical protein